MVGHLCQIVFYTDGLYELRKWLKTNTLSPPQDIKIISLTENWLFLETNQDITYCRKQPNQMETTTLLFCGKPALPAQAVVKQSQLLISLGAHKMTPSAECKSLTKALRRSLWHLMQVLIIIEATLLRLRPLPRSHAFNHKDSSGLVWIIHVRTKISLKFFITIIIFHEKAPFTKLAAFTYTCEIRGSQGFLGWLLCMPDDHSH